MSTKLTCSTLPSSILTPSTIQCTKFYSDAMPTTTKSLLIKHRHSASNDMKRYLSSKDEPHRRTITKSATVPLITHKARVPPSLISRSLSTFECLTKQLAENVRIF